MKKENKNGEKQENDKEFQKVLKFEKFIKVTLIIACVLLIIALILSVFEQIGKVKNWDINIWQLVSDIALNLVKNGLMILLYSSIAIRTVRDIKKGKNKHRPKAQKLDEIILGVFITFIIFQIGYTIGYLIEAII